MSTFGSRLAISLLVLAACGDDSSADTQTEGSPSSSTITTAGLPQTTTTSPTTGDPSTTTDPTTGVSTTDPLTSTTTTTTTETTTETTGTTGATDDTTTTTTGDLDPCKDGEKNGVETDIDCGGADCSACADGSACVDDSDCQGMSCIANTCEQPAAECDDAVKNGVETDIDCGGPACPACADALDCAVDSDCKSQSCADDVCQAPSCSDEVRNGSESDVDCGGPDCGPCEDGLTCGGPEDCQSGACDGNVCVPGSCNDGAENGDETDVDCGGGTCDPCEDGLGCEIDGDCLGDSCEGGTCTSPSCDDGLQNGAETGVDCGGPDCPACPIAGLVINEVDYDQPGSDNAEFIEILNTSGVPIALANHAVVLVNGATDTTYATINLGGSLQPGQYLVLANANFVVPPAAVKVTITNGIVQNGGADPDGIALVNKTTKKVVDALSYDGAITSVNIAGIGVVSLVEGAPLPASVIDDPGSAGSLSRLPNGQDNNNAASDWDFTTKPTPGAANLP